VKASTIVNEVTSIRPSTLEGPLEVLGPRAHVVVANPNGITANGVEFRNVGGVALATGEVSFDAAGRATLAVSRGVLTVGAGGLSGMMAQLDLLAKEIRVAGSVVNTSSNAEAKVNLTAGSSATTLSAGITPEGIAGWSSTVAGAGPAPEIAVDIAEGGVLSSGAIRVRVTDAGAGVRMAGEAVATGNDVRIDATGSVKLANVAIKAPGAIAIEAKSISVGSDARQSEIV